MNTARLEFQAARKAPGTEWNRAAVFIGTGGSIPAAAFFREVPGMDAMLTGFTNDDDAIHSPAEKYNLESFRKGIRSWAHVLHEITNPSRVIGHRVDDS